MVQFIKSLLKVELKVELTTEICGSKNSHSKLLKKIAEIKTEKIKPKKLNSLQPLVTELHDWNSVKNGGAYSPIHNG